MKSIYYYQLGLLFFGVLLFSCSDSDELVLEEPSHRVVFTSEQDFGNTIEVDGIISFGDVSAGVESRTWTFPSGVVDIQGSDVDDSSSEANVTTTFTQAGVFDVHLHQVFKNDAYVGETLKGKELDTTIVVTVLDYVEVEVEAYYLDENGNATGSLEIKPDAMNELSASEKVRFVVKATGRPAEYNWDFDDARPAVLSTADSFTDVQYIRTGTYDVSLIAGRDRPYGRDTIILENFLNVIPSTKPVTLDAVEELDGSIALSFSREMDPNSLSPNDFSVEIQNQVSLSPAVSSVSISTTEGNIVLLTLDGEKMYNDDSVLVSYEPGSLRTLDGVDAEAFTNELMSFNLVNIFEAESAIDYSFEESMATNWPYLWWGGIWEYFDLSISSAQSHTGSMSAYIEYQANGGMIIGPKDDDGNNLTFNVEAGRVYELGVWIYLVDNGNNLPGEFLPDLRFYWGPDTNWGVGPNPEFTDSMPTNEWVYSSILVEFDAAGEKTLMIRGFNEFNPEPVKFYMDDITLAEVELRPN